MAFRVAIALIILAAPALTVNANPSRPGGVRIPISTRPIGRTSGLPTPIFAGGGSVPALMLRSWGDTFGVALGQPVNPSKPNIEMLFASTNGPAGERYLIDQAFDNIDTPASKPPYNDTTNGRNWTFPYPNSMSAPAPPDYVVGSPLSNLQTMQYAYSTFPTRGPAEQEPLVYSAIALPNNLGPYSSLGSRTLKLSRNTYCGIFTGLIIDWLDPSITADNGGMPVVSVSTPIDVVYRADSAGTTFIYTTHLNYVCGATSYPYNQGVGEIFNLPNPIPPGSNFVGAVGGSAMITDIQHPANPTHGAVGYIGAGSILPYVQNGLNPPSLINAAGRAVQPTIAAVKRAFRTGPYTSAPPGYPDRKKTYVPDPSGKKAYPIVGQIYFLFYHCFPASNPNIPAMQAFFHAALAPQNGGGPTIYDLLAENTFGLAELPDNRKNQVLRTIAQIKFVQSSGTCK